MGLKRNIFIDIWKQNKIILTVELYLSNNIILMEIVQVIMIWVYIDI